MNLLVRYGRPVATGIFFWRGFFGSLSEGNRTAHISGGNKASAQRNNFRFIPAGTYHFLTVGSQSAPKILAASFS